MAMPIKSFYRLPIGMENCNLQVLYKLLALQSPIKSANCKGNCCADQLSNHLVGTGHCVTLRTLGESNFLRVG